ncbi:MAG: amino acid racemase [Trueperaceae bacterium]
MANLTVGVLGGMGPDATLDFFAKLLAATPAARDQDRLRIIIDNNPKVPNRNDAVAGRGPSSAPLLAQMASGLERAGAELLAMPCNAAHAFAGDIEAAVNIPLVNIIDETIEATLRRVPGIGRVGVLAAAGCLDARLYSDGLEARGIVAIEPLAQQREIFMELLYRIKSGDLGGDVRARMLALAGEFIDAGAKVIIAGCTEVPLVLAQSDLPCPLVNSTDVLVQATADYATGKRSVNDLGRATTP